MIPYVLDDLTLTEVARGDADLIRLILSFDAAGQALVVPVLAAAAAYRDNPGPDAADSLRGIPELDHAMSAPVGDIAQAIRLIEIAEKTGLDVCAAQVAAVADASVCPILTVDADRWRRASASLSDPLHVIEIADPGENPDRALQARGVVGSRAGFLAVRNASRTGTCRRHHGPVREEQLAGGRNAREVVTLAEPRCSGNRTISPPGTRPPRGGNECFLHGDPGPFNAIFCGGLPVAFIES